MFSYLGEVKSRNAQGHLNGTYVALNADQKTRDSLAKWVKENNIPNPADPKQYHSTVIYSRKGIPSVTNYKFTFPIEGTIKEWKIFPSGESNKCLVAIIDCDELHNLHTKIREKYGATHDFPDYHPHITLSYDYGNNKVPPSLPDVPISYGSRTIEPLDDGK